jgi:predicted phosphodiesterase
VTPETQSGRCAGFPQERCFRYDESMDNRWVIGRRAFLRNGTLMLGAGVFGGKEALHALSTGGDSDKGKPVLKIGLVTDVHFAEKDARINRYYRESLAKLRDGIELFTAKEAGFLVELGDLVDDAGSLSEEIGYLEKISGELRRFKGEWFHVFGNHCLAKFSKQEFVQHAGLKGDSYHSFDRGSFHFVVLDACFRTDGQAYERGNFEWTDTDIPAVEREWLRADLAATSKPSVVFVHQRLDVEDHYAARSAGLVREILEKSGKVTAVFQGHSHKNDYSEIGGIHYCTLRAMVEGSGQDNSGYGLLEIFGDGSMHLAGFRQQHSRDFLRKPSPASGPH